MDTTERRGETRAGPWKGVLVPHHGMAPVSEELRKSLEARLPALLGGPVQIAKLSLLAGGASMEAWAVEPRAPALPSRHWRRFARAPRHRRARRAARFRR